MIRRLKKSNHWITSIYRQRCSTKFDLTPTYHSINSYGQQSTIKRVNISDDWMKRHFFFGSSSTTTEAILHNEVYELGFSLDQLMNVVSNVEAYDEFLPFCESSRVWTDSSKNQWGRLEVGYGSFKASYDSHLRQGKNWVEAEASQDDPLFRQLFCKWHFEQLDDHRTQLVFHVSFAFRNPLYQAVASSTFSPIVESMTSSFEKRCQQLYGKPSIPLKKTQ